MCQVINIGEEKQRGEHGALRHPEVTSHIGDESLSMTELLAEGKKISIT